MSAKWKEVARLGGSGARYPHLLADPHGWCVRWGPNRSKDDKYYSNLHSLLEGMVEHTVRRRLWVLSAALDLPAFVEEVRDALRSARDLATSGVEMAVTVTHLCRVEPPDGGGMSHVPSSSPSGPPTGAGDGRLRRALRLPAREPEAAASPSAQELAKQAMTPPAA